MDPRRNLFGQPSAGGEEAGGSRPSGDFPLADDHGLYSQAPSSPYESGERGQEAGRPMPGTSGSAKRGSSNHSTDRTSRKKSRLSSSSASESRGRNSAQVGVMLEGIMEKLDVQTQAVGTKIEEFIAWEEQREEKEEQREEKAEEEIDRCWALVAECGIIEGSDEYEAATPLFRDPYYRKHFLHRLSTNERRVAWLKRQALNHKV